MMKKVVLTLICVVFVILCVCLLPEKHEMVQYPVVKAAAQGDELDTSAVLYIASVQSSVWDAGENLLLHYFQDREAEDGVFLQPVFQNGMCAEERYFASEQKYKENDYSAAEGSPIWEPTFHLAGKTSKADPAMLLYHDAILYCVIGETAYLIYDDGQPVPQSIAVGEICHDENRIVYAVQKDGSFSLVS